ncbi:hypothetical protein QVD17_08879 [Tagetes erecta]|uniref:Uncharacterized protein n=1 Tax=Tagetes erecta TaxID=13708 RepID=A0AAD8KYD5_TARER|nr:hypothetical protein QVD17_08879 [Tagetes erecta]
MAKKAAENFNENSKLQLLLLYESQQPPYFAFLAIQFSHYLRLFFLSNSHPRSNLLLNHTKLLKLQSDLVGSSTAVQELQCGYHFVLYDNGSDGNMYHFVAFCVLNAGYYTSCTVLFRAFDVNRFTSHLSRYVKIIKKILRETYDSTSNACGQKVQREMQSDLCIAPAIDVKAPTGGT